MNAVLRPWLNRKCVDETRRGLENASAFAGKVWRRPETCVTCPCVLIPARSVALNPFSTYCTTLPEMLSAIARRAVARSAPRATRNFASEVQHQANAFIAERAAIEAHAGGT